MDEQAIQAAVASLIRVRREHHALGSFPVTAEPQSMDDAYQVQDALVATLRETVVGWKIGCTSKMAQEMSSTDEPFYGRMLAATTHDTPATLEIEALFAPIVEPEIAFRLGRDLSPEGAPYEKQHVLDAVDAMYPAIEIVDCRYAQGWPITIVPTVADNGVHAAFVLGPPVPRWRTVDRTAIPIRAEVNGRFVTDGIGANALDDPLNALVWLANRCTGRGHSLKAGEFITTGNTANAPIFAKPGDAVRTTFGGLGEVWVDFSGSI